MTLDQILALSILGAALVMFVWGRWRYDFVAFAALILAVVVGIVPSREAFAGFGHPAVITVAAVLILSRGLQLSGAVEAVAARLIPDTKRDVLFIGAFGAVAAILSGFMNNVGALALLMPVALQAAARSGRSPALILMPLSFATILGGLFTLIGTPPNIIIASFRAESAGRAFSMFDFAPVGGAITIAGLIFVAFVGWRLIPKERLKRKSERDLFDIEDYVAEARIAEGSEFIGKTLRETEAAADEHGVSVVGLIRKKNKISLDRRRRMEKGDLLILEAAPDGLGKAVKALGLELVAGGKAIDDLSSDDVMLMEGVVTPQSELVGQTPEQIKFRRRWRINLLAATRQGVAYRGRLKDFRFAAGDVVLLQGDVEHLPSVIPRMGLLPLPERGVSLEPPKTAAIAVGLFLLAIGLTASGLLAAPIAFGAAILGMLLFRVLRLDEAYDAIDWPIIVLLGALIPVGGALETTGVTAAFAGLVGGTAGILPTWLILALVMVVTMTLSDIVNNAATAVVMAPISIGIAKQLGVDPDPFLMAVAIGASCAFLTPIGHQNNTLVLGPGGYRFGDYWRMGLPLEALIVVISIPLLLLVWPL